MTTSTGGSLTPTTAHPLALLHPPRSKMNPEAFTPKTTENFASLLGYLKRKSLFPQPRDVSHARSFAEGVFEGRACPVAALSGRADSRFHEGGNKPMFIPQDQ